MRFPFSANNQHLPPHYSSAAELSPAVTWHALSEINSLTWASIVLLLLAILFLNTTHQKLLLVLDLAVLHLSTMIFLAPWCFHHEGENLALLHDLIRDPCFWLYFVTIGSLLHVLQSRWRSLLLIARQYAVLWRTNVFFSIAQHYGACCFWIWQTKQLISAPWSYVLCFYYIFVALLYLGSGMQHHRCHWQSLYTDIIPYTTHHLTWDDLHKSAKHTSEINPDGISKHPWPSWVSWWVLCNFRILKSLVYHYPFDCQSLSIFNTALYERKVPRHRYFR